MPKTREGRRLDFGIWTFGMRRQTKPRGLGDSSERVPFLTVLSLGLPFSNPTWRAGKIQ